MPLTQLLLLIRSFKSDKTMHSSNLCSAQIIIIKLSQSHQLFLQVFFVYLLYFQQRARHVRRQEILFYFTHGFIFFFKSNSVIYVLYTMCSVLQLVDDHLARVNFSPQNSLYYMCLVRSGYNGCPLMITGRFCSIHITSSTHRNQNPGADVKEF